MTKGYKQVDGEYLDKNGRHVSTIKAVYIVELEERIASLEAALQRIVDFHIGDCPAAVEEIDFAKNINLEIRRIARAALGDAS